MTRALVFAFPAALALAACNQAAPPAPAPSPAPAEQLAKGPASQPAKGMSAEKGTTPASRDDRDADGVVRRGAVSKKGKVLTVSAVMKEADKLAGKRVKVSGTVEQVCAKKGCWWMMQGKDQTERIRITSKGYKFFVPRKAKGMKAVAEGVLEAKHLSEAEAQHLLDDAREAGDTEVKEAPRFELRIAAEALEMKGGA